MHKRGEEDCVNTNAFSLDADHDVDEARRFRCCNYSTEVKRAAEAYIGGKRVTAGVVLYPRSLPHPTYGPACVELP